MTPAVAKVGCAGYIQCSSRKYPTYQPFGGPSGPRSQRRSAMAPAKQKNEKDYEDIPGTYVFDAERSRQGYHLNMFCMSLMKAENRKAFKANEAEYLNRFPLTPEQREAILKRQYNRMLELGGNRSVEGNRSRSGRDAAKKPAPRKAAAKAPAKPRAKSARPTAAKRGKKT